MLHIEVRLVGTNGETLAQASIDDRGQHAMWVTSYRNVVLEKQQDEERRKQEVERRRRAAEEAARREAALKAQQQAQQEKEEAERRAAHKRFDAFVEKYRVQAWPDMNRVSVNPFVYEGKTIALAAKFETMLTATDGLFNRQTNYFVVSDIPKGLLTYPGSVVVAGSILGKTEVQLPLFGKVLVPHLKFAGIYFCQAHECEDILVFANPTVMGILLRSYKLMLTDFYSFQATRSRSNSSMID